MSFLIRNFCKTYIMLSCFQKFSDKNGKSGIANVLVCRLGHPLPRLLETEFSTSSGPSSTINSWKSPFIFVFWQQMFFDKCQEHQTQSKSRIPACWTYSQKTSLFIPVLGIRDILVRIRIPFLQWLKGCKKYFFFFIFFSYNLPTGKLSSVVKVKFLL